MSKIYVCLKRGSNNLNIYPSLGGFWLDEDSAFGFCQLVSYLIEAVTSYKRTAFSPAFDEKYLTPLDNLFPCWQQIVNCSFVELRVATLRIKDTHIVHPNTASQNFEVNPQPACSHHKSQLFNHNVGLYSLLKPVKHSACDKQFVNLSPKKKTVRVLAAMLVRHAINICNQFRYYERL